MIKISDNECSINGNKTDVMAELQVLTKYILKGLAAAVVQTINSLPEDYQQENRIIFLQYLNKATTQIQEE